MLLKFKKKNLKIIICVEIVIEKLKCIMCEKKNLNDYVLGRCLKFLFRIS